MAKKRLSEKEKRIASLLRSFLVSQHGLKIQEDRYNYGIVSYAGHNRSFYVPNIKKYDLSWVHELCHFIVSTEERRKYDDFGLSMPEWRAELPYFRSVIDEYRVVTLESILLNRRKIGTRFWELSGGELVLPFFHKRGDVYHDTEMKFSSKDEDKTLAAIEWLYRKGIISHKTKEYKFKINK